MTTTPPIDQPASPQRRRNVSDRENLLEVEGLVKHFPIKGGFLRGSTSAVQAVDGVDFSVRRRAAPSGCSARTSRTCPTPRCDRCAVTCR